MISKLLELVVCNVVGVLKNSLIVKEPLFGHVSHVCLHIKVVRQVSVKFSCHLRAHHIANNCESLSIPIELGLLAVVSKPL